MIGSWTIKALLRARARVVGSILAVGASFALVITFRAVWEGETQQLAVYLERAGADVWVMQAHVSNMHMASSFISEGKRHEIAKVDGVQSVAGILYLNTMVQAGGRQWFCYVVGIDEADQPGGPWSLAEGRGGVSLGEAVIPATLSRLTGTGIGDGIQIADRRFTVVGLSNETFSVTNPVAFVHASDLADLLSLTGYDSYILVRAEAGVAPGDLATRIDEEIDGVAALTTAEFVDNDLQLASQMGTEVIALMTMICAALATLLVGFSLFIHTSRTRRELVILKTVGFSNRHIYGSVLLQAMLLTGLAFGVAVGLVEVLAVVGPLLAPILSLRITFGALLEIGVAGLAVALAATLMLAHRIASVGGPDVDLQRQEIVEAARLLGQCVASRSDGSLEVGAADRTVGGGQVADSAGHDVVTEGSGDLARHAYVRVALQATEQPSVDIASVPRQSLERAVLHVEAVELRLAVAGHGDHEPLVAGERLVPVLRDRLPERRAGDPREPPLVDVPIPVAQHQVHESRPQVCLDIDACRGIVGDELQHVTAAEDLHRVEGAGGSIRARLRILGEGAEQAGVLLAELTEARVVGQDHEVVFKLQHAGGRPERQRHQRGSRHARRDLVLYQLLERGAQELRREHFRGVLVDGPEGVALAIGATQVLESLACVIRVKCRQRCLVVHAECRLEDLPAELAAIARIDELGNDRDTDKPAHRIGRCQQSVSH